MSPKPELAVTEQTARPEASAPMPWLLILLVAVTTGTAVVAQTDTERLIVLAVAEGIIVAYFCIALRASMKAVDAKASPGAVDGEQGRTGS